MKLPACIALLIAIYFTLPAGLAGQQSQPAGTISSQNTQAATVPGKQPVVSSENIPVYTVEFKQQSSVPGITASPLVSLPILCSPSGTPYITVPEPPMYSERTIYSLDGKNPRTFSYKNVQGIYDLQFLNFFPTDEAVYVFLSATKDPKQSDYTLHSSDGQVLGRGAGYHGERHSFILKFDIPGTLKSTIQLPDNLSFHRIAPLPDGTFVAIAYDSLNAAARLLLLADDGTILRYLSLPSELEQTPELQHGAIGDESDRARAQTSLAQWLFAPVRGRILLFAAHSNAPVVEIGAAGVTREVSISAPKDYSLSAVIASNDKWLFRYARKALPMVGETENRPESRNYLLYEIDPDDGHIKSEIDPGAGPSFGIACEHDSVLTGFSLGSDSKYLLYTADTPR